MKRRLLTLLFVAGLVVVGTVAVACDGGGRPGALTIEVTEDVAYTSIRELDVSAPTGPGPWPLVVVLHGSGFNRSLYATLSKEIASQGAVVFNVSWRVVGSRAALEDVACAVRFARARATDYGGDPMRVTLFGHSAGAFVGSVIALAGDDFEGDCLVSGVSALPDAFLGLAAAYDPEETPFADKKEEDPDLYEAATPLTHLGGNPDLRVRLLHGDNDTTVPLETSVQFQEALEEAGYDVTLTVLEGASHSPISPSVKGFETTVQEVLKATEGG